MAKYAENTSVPVAKSRAEIEATLAKYGATAFRYGWNQARAMIEFAAHDRMIRFSLPLPDAMSEEFTHKLNRRTNPPKREPRSDGERTKAYEQACRQKWRALALAIKAKLEAVDAGISLFEQEFLANIVDPATNKTVYEVIGEQLRLSYEENANAQPLLLLPRE